MSRIGKKPVELTAGVQAAVEGQTVKIKGPKGDLTLQVPAEISVKVEGNEVVVTPIADTPFARAMHGTIRSLISNMIVGVHTGYTRELEIQGVGFKASVQGQKLNLALGYSHPIDFDIPDGITIKVADGTNIAVSGADKQLVGQVSSRIRSFYPAEPYKGKGVRYKGEHVRRKAGKAVA
ncbi:MAG TPA: 50S ribosomal protein L6 [Kiritimatiellia bacterium]|nr:50S ribosomal protein L6 [Kiritimatiellia bacterium]HMO98837.1 50S ribosomal protein L6 [Kiritimatiellia bacterium]HMP96215.1 50S ribosomal protein L6 [Kiritimatiellia bacterium]